MPAYLKITKNRAYYMNFPRLLRRASRSQGQWMAIGMFSKMYVLYRDQCDYCDYDFQKLLSFVEPCIVSSIVLGVGVAILQETIDCCMTWLNEHGVREVMGAQNV
jgi:hypothetical protein